MNNNDYTVGYEAIAGKGRRLSKRLKEALNYRKGNVGHQELAAWVEGLEL